MDQNDITPDRLATKWFVYAFFGAIAYLSVVYVFVYGADVGPNQYAPEVEARD
jgi:hypothetical protein